MTRTIDKPWLGLASLIINTTLSIIAISKCRCNSWLTFPMFSDWRWPQIREGATNAWVTWWSCFGHMTWQCHWIDELSFKYCENHSPLSVVLRYHLALLVTEDVSPPRGAAVRLGELCYGTYGTATYRSALQFTRLLLAINYYCDSNFKCQEHRQ